MLIINNAVYMVCSSFLNLFEPVDTFEEKPEASRAAQDTHQKSE